MKFQNQCAFLCDCGTSLGGKVWATQSDHEFTAKKLTEASISFKILKNDKKIVESNLFSQDQPKTICLF
jgi:hypothetical protein